MVGSFRVSDCSKSPNHNRLADVDGLIVDELSFMLKILSGYVKVKP